MILDVIWIITLGLLLFVVVQRFTPLGRPDLKDWKPYGNTGNQDGIAAYKRAAEKLGIEIQIGYPIPGDNSDICAGMGMRGIYIRRSQAALARQLQDATWAEEKAMRE